MEEALLQSCEAVSQCLENIENTRPHSGWDLKAALMALGITISLGWQLVTHIQTKKVREADRKWSMFKDEVYTPFLLLLDEFEKEVKPTFLPTLLQKKNLDEVQVILGEFSARLSEIELLCQRADQHKYSHAKSCQSNYQELSQHLDTCIGKMFQNSMNEPSVLKDVASAYSTLIQGLRQQLTCERDKLGK